jgi:hypothetical protein
MAPHDLVVLALDYKTVRFAVQSYGVQNRGLDQPVRQAEVGQAVTVA